MQVAPQSADNHLSSLVYCGNMQAGMSEQAEEQVCSNTLGPPAACPDIVSAQQV